MVRNLYKRWKSATWDKADEREYPQPEHESKDTDPRFSLWWADHPQLSFYEAQQEFLHDTGIPYDFRTM